MDHSRWTWSLDNTKLEITYPEIKGLPEKKLQMTSDIMLDSLSNLPYASFMRKENLTPDQESVLRSFLSAPLQCLTKINNANTQTKTIPQTNQDIWTGVI